MSCNGYPGWRHWLANFNPSGRLTKPKQRQPDSGASLLDPASEKAIPIAECAINPLFVSSGIVSQPAEVSPPLSVCLR